MKVKLLAGVAMAGLFAAGAASADPNGWYGAVDVGYHMPEANTNASRVAAQLSAVECLEREVGRNVAPAFFFQRPALHQEAGERRDERDADQRQQAGSLHAPSSGLVTAAATHSR